MSTAAVVSVVTACARSVLGCPVRVEVLGSEQNVVKGLVCWERDLGGWYVAASGVLQGRELARTLLHEVGHVALGHVGRLGSPQLQAERAVMAGTGTTATARALLRDTEQADRERERAADKWADEHLNRVMVVVNMLDRQYKTSRG